MNQPMYVVVSVWVWDRIFCWLTWRSCRLRIRRALVWTYLVRHRMQQRLCMPCQTQGFAIATIVLQCLARLLQWGWSVGQLPCWQRPALMACFPPSAQMKREMIWNIMKLPHVHPHPVRKQAGPTVKKEQCRPWCCPNMHITEFVRKFGMCTINLLHKSCYIHWGQACSQNALNAQFHWLNSAQKPECEAWTSGTELEDDGGNGYIGQHSKFFIWESFGIHFKWFKHGYFPCDPTWSDLPT